MKSFVRKIIRSLSREVQSTLPQPPLVDRVVDHLLGKVDLTQLNDAVAFAGDVRQCLEPLKCKIKILKQPPKLETQSDAGFKAFTDLLRASLPSVPASQALQFASICDKYKGETTVSLSKNHASDVRRHFVVSSSSGRKGRLLSSLVQAFEPHLTLELGTAYGISGFFMASALRRMSDPASRRLVTVEGFEPQATLSRTLLQQEFGDAVTCEFGVSKESLPRLSQTLDKIDLYFHDAGHTYDDYVNDVTIMLPKMNSGSVLFLDDIRWDDRRFISQPSRAYEGWQAIVANPRTRAAAEIDDEIGIAVFS